MNLFVSNIIFIWRATVLKIKKEDFKWKNYWKILIGCKVIIINKCKMKTIFNQRLCGYLQMKGFILVDIKPNKNGNGKNVFFFKESPELLEAMQEYIDGNNN